MWKLEIYDHTGLTTAAVHQLTDGPPTVYGDADTLAHFLPEIARLPIFLTDPEHHARAAYQAYVEHFPSATGHPTWQELRDDPKLKLLHDRWLCIGQAAARAKPDCN